MNGIHERWKHIAELPEPDAKGMEFAQMVRDRGDEARAAALAALDES